MKKLFQTWLFVFVSGAFLLTFGVSWKIHSALARDSAIALLRVKLDDARKQLEHARQNLETVIHMSDAAALSKARALSLIIASDNSALKNPVALEKIRKNLDVDEIHVSDENGILIASIPQNYQGYDMAASAQSAEFLGALTNPNFELVQPPMPNGIQKKLFQYVGVARSDRCGLVQIGYRPERIEEATKIADIRNIASTFRIGRNGMLRISKNENPESFSECIFSETVNGWPSLCLSVACGNYVLTGSIPEEEMYLSRNSVLQILVIANLLLFGVIFLLVSVLLQKIVIRGIYSVNNSLEKITDGDLEEKIVVRTTSEFTALSDGINATVTALKKSIENESRRIDAELELGRSIQASVLPTDFPDNPEFRLAAGMYAAKEVGGDFYDFFEIGTRRIAALVADVSGKGITAALYMMNSKARLKELLLSESNPAEAFSRANLELCRNNRANMFLTVFLAVLDLDAKTLVCVNAGHNPPLRKSFGGSWEFLRIKHSVALGASPKARFTSVKLPLESGDRFFLYTDGVTEAKNTANELFGEARLRCALEASASDAPEDLIAEIKTHLEAFSNGVPQSDDITMLSMDFFAFPPRNPHKQKERPAFPRVLKVVAGAGLEPVTN